MIRGTPRYSRVAPTVSIAALIALSGCVLPPKAEPQLKTIAAEAVGLTMNNGPLVPDRWWAAYADPQFDALLDEALAHNPTLAQAVARVGIAQAQVQAANGGRQPQMRLQGEEIRQRYPERFIYPPPFGGGVYWQGSLEAMLSWDIDFWGQQRALIENAGASTNAAVLDAQAARLAIAGSLTQAYLDLNRAYALADIAQRSAQQREDILKITRRRIAAGLDTNVELREAETAVPQAELARLQAESARELAVHRVALLAGKGAERYDSVQRPTLNVAAALELPAELPLDLLGRRPDVLAARARVTAAQAQRKAAHAAFYPNINLSAFAGFQAIGLDNLLKTEDRTFGAGPAISLPIFNSVRLKSQFNAATAATDVAIAGYNDTVLKAVQQTADQLSLVRSSERELVQAQASLTAAEEAYRLAQRRYGAGLANYLSVLTTETQVLNARTSYVNILHAQAMARVGLLLAVGGNFDPQRQLVGEVK